MGEAPAVSAVLCGPDCSHIHITSYNSHHLAQGDRRALEHKEHHPTTLAHAQELGSRVFGKNGSIPVVTVRCDLDGGPRQGEDAAEGRKCQCDEDANGTEDEYWESAAIVEGIRMRGAGIIVRARRSDE
jgi:hypothetical protein